MSIRVYIISEINNQRCQLLDKMLFSNGSFEVKIPNFENIKNDDTERNKILTCLINSKSECPNKPVLIIKDSSTATCDSNTLYNLLNRQVEKDNFHLFYLCRWLDNCEINDSLSNTELTNIMHTLNPQGTQAILYSQDGRDKVIDILRKDVTTDELSDILLTNIKNKKLSAICSSPNIVNFDINLSINKDKDLYKINTCGYEEPDYSQYYIIFIFLCVVLFILKKSY